MYSQSERIDVVNIKNAPMLCQIPFNQVLVDQKGDAYLCCGSYIKNMSPVAGNLLEHDAFEIWNNAQYRAFRLSFVDGSFRFCRDDTCNAAANRHDPATRHIIHSLEDIKNNPHLAEGNFRKFLDAPNTFDGSLAHPPTRLYLGMDPSCNLKCPSCRDSLIQEDKGTGRLDKLYANLRSITPGIETLELDGAGDVFASSWYQSFLKDFPEEDFPNLQEITFRSNGLLWNEKNWYRIHPTFRAKRIIASISVDAASAETYQKVRGGCFDTLMTNLNFIGSLLGKGELLSMTLIMVYRKSNYFEIPAFIDMAKNLGANYVVIHPLQAWEESAYVINGEYDDEAIHLPSHPEHQRFKEFIAANNVKHGQDEYTYVDFSY